MHGKRDKVKRRSANCEEIIKKENIAAYYFGIAKKFNISRENPDGVKSYLNKLLA